jgi:hypothetical protein
MKSLAELLSRDLGNIHGARESGPNGDKRTFHTKGRAFLSALAKDLGLAEKRVTSNYAGIAVSGEVYLRGMWSDGDGLYIELAQPTIGCNVLHYGAITAMNGLVRGQYRTISLTKLRAADYAGLLLELQGEIHTATNAA